MSYNGINDKDLDLKLLVSNYLWNLGYVCRPCVYLHHYSRGKRTSKRFTDIDVLGIKYDSIDKPQIIVCSAKGAKASDSQQVFWLSGVKQYFNADNAIYVAEKASTIGISEILKKLQITSLNRNELFRISNNYGIDLNNPRYLNSKECYETSYELFNKLKEYNKSIYNYITEKYWIDRVNHRILRILSCMKDIKKMDIHPNEKRFYLYYCINLFSMAIIEIIFKLSNIPNSLFLNALETELLGGEYSETEKKNLIKNIEALLKQYTKLIQSKLTMPIKNIVDFDNLLQIPHNEQLYELCIRLRESMQSLTQLPRLFDVITFEVVQTGFTKIDDSIFKGISNFTDEEIKKMKAVIRHVLIFFERIEIFDLEEIKYLIEI